MTPRPELSALKAEAAARTCASWAAERGWTLARAGAELVGPCPVCGGTDRFAIHTAKNVWQCRKCGVGGDVIFLVQHTEGCSFVEACEKLAGRRASDPVDPKRAEELQKKAAREAEWRERRAERYRAEARLDARRIWDESAPAGPLVSAYFKARGLAGAELQIDRRVVREQRALDYVIGGQAIYAGPAMVAGMQLPNGNFAGVHRTWLADSLAGGCRDSHKGKAIVTDAEGKVYPAKMTRGTVHTAAIRLKHPPGATRLVIGEGIETTLSVLLAELRGDTAYWAAANLGNMAGRGYRDSSGTLHRAEPDLGDTNCFICPDWVTELVFLGDGDSEPGFTRDALNRAKRRAIELRKRTTGAISLRVGISWPGEGIDFNDLAMRAAE